MCIRDRNPGVENFGHEAGADTLDRVRSFGAARKYRRSIRFYGDSLERGFAFLDHLADAGNRAAGADAGNQDVHLAIGIAPDFFGRRAAVDVGVGRVIELLSLIHI